MTKQRKPRLLSDCCEIGVDLFLERSSVVQYKFEAYVTRVIQMVFPLSARLFLSMDCLFFQWTVLIPRVK